MSIKVQSYRDNFSIQYNDAAAGMTRSRQCGRKKDRSEIYSSQRLQRKNREKAKVTPNRSVSEAHMCLGISGKSDRRGNAFEGVVNEIGQAVQRKKRTDKWNGRYNIGTR